MAYKVVLLFLALMLFVGACRSQEMVGDEDAFNALRDLMLREARGSNSRNAQVYRSIRGGTNLPFVFGGSASRKLPRFVRRDPEV